MTELSLYLENVCEGGEKQHFMCTVLHGGTLACFCLGMELHAVLAQAGCTASGLGRCLHASVVKYSLL